ncbi:MAG: hypothetical protein ACYC3A_09230 [Halothiobacillus sp.]
MNPNLIKRVSIRWVLAYIVAAALWITLMQWLLGSLGGERWTISAAGLVVGGIFVLITAWLLFLLLERAQTLTPASPHELIQLTHQARLWWAALILLIGFTLLLQVFMVSFATREYRPVLINQAQTELTAQLRVHSKLINDWFDSRNQAVDTLAAQPGLLAERIKADQTRSTKTLKELGILIAHNPFQQITVYDPDHRQTAQFGQSNAAKAPDSLFEQAAATSKVQFACQFTPGRMGGDCYWVLPLFLNQKDVSSGPWYLVFYAELTAQTLVQQTAHTEPLTLENAVRTLVLLTPEEDHPEQWVSTPLMADLSRINSLPQRDGVQAVSAQDLACFRQSTAFPARVAMDHRQPHAPSTVPSVNPRASGQMTCEGQTVLYASVNLSKIPALLWVSTTQDAVLHPLRRTRQWLAVAALLGVSTLMFSLFFLWKIMRINRKKSLHSMQRERDQLAQLWEQIPTLGLAIATRSTAQAPWLINNINRRCMQLFHATRENLVGSPLSMLMLPVAGQNDPIDYLIADQQSLDDLVSGIRDEITFTRRLRIGEHGVAWRQFSIRALHVAESPTASLIVAIENLGDTVEQADQLQAERDFYRLAAEFLREEPTDTLPVSTGNDAAPDVDVKDGQEEKPVPLNAWGENLREKSGEALEGITEQSAPIAETRFAQYGAQLIAQTRLVALCRYTHWPEVWSSSSDLTGPILEQQEHKSYECVGGSAPVRDIANQVAAMGLIDRVLVAQTPLFIDDEAKNTPASPNATLQTELIEQLRPYPVSALAVVPISGVLEAGCVQAWIVFGDEKLRFTDPVKTALLSLLSALSRRVGL